MHRGAERTEGFPAESQWSAWLVENKLEMEVQVPLSSKNLYEAMNPVWNNLSSFYNNFEEEQSNSRVVCDKEIKMKIFQRRAVHPSLVAGFCSSPAAM